MNVLAKNGVLAMVSVTGGSRQLEVSADNSSAFRDVRDTMT